MISRAEYLDKIDAALSIAPQSSDESIDYPIIKELRDHYEDALKTIIIQEDEHAEIDMKSFLLLKSIVERIYPEKAGHEIVLIAIKIREQLRKIFGLHPLTMLRK